jgi:ATP-dependent protease ClpP protease subunit
MKEVYINGIIGSPEDQNEFDNYSVYSFDNLIEDLDGATEAKIFIDSVGGMVEEGLKIYDYLSSINAETIAINASSIASIIFLAGKKRLVKPGAKMIIHNAWLKGEDIESDVILNANTINELKEAFIRQDAQLVSIYKQKTGISETQLLALMAQDTDIADKAIDLGFAHGAYEGEKEQARELNGCIMFNAAYRNMKTNLNIDKMANEQTNEKLNAVEKTLNGLKNFLFGKSKNMAIQLEDGTPLFIYSEDGEFVGKRAVLADAEGLPTEEDAPSGTHRLSDGRSIVVGEGGIIESVEEAVDAEALAAELAAMKEEKEKAMEEKEDLENRIAAMAEAMEAKEAEFKTNFNALEAEFKALKKEVIGEIEEPKVKAQITDEEFAKLSFAEKFKLKMVAKAENK